MNKFRSLYLVLAMSIALAASMTGCGGGGGGGGGGTTDTGTTVLTIPAANQITPPALYTSKAFPTIGPNVELTVNNFAAASEALMVFLNMSDSIQHLTWGADKLPAAASTRKNVFASNSKVEEKGSIAPEHSFHLMLRQQSQHQRRLRPAQEAPRGSMRAVTVGEELNFTLYKNDTQTEIVTAVCKHTELLAGTDKNFHIFIDKTSANLANIGLVVAEIATNWRNIYVKNREVLV
ncbi:MAG: hypothetical protein KKB51_04730 [Candidatus Riflebacteria bacterium]|nr:hypothetical protein [Candidatus Riflebacteria bacterium]